MSSIFDIRDKEYVSQCLRGEQLFGDSFTQEEIDKWYKLEEQAYSNLIGNETYEYGYHELNRFLAFGRLPSGCKFEKVLSYGGACGDELLPIINRIKDVTILEPGDNFQNHHLGDKKVSYIKPVSSGVMPFDDNVFDLITCFGVLHHVPNVSFIVSEMYRVLKKGGYVIIREPIISMGDWNTDRKGLTPCERGIYIKLFKNIIQKCSFKIFKKYYCGFPLTRLCFGNVFSNFFLTRLDYLLCLIFKWNSIYYTKINIRKLRPGFVMLILYKE